jgi:nucleoside-diphosphate-sugar epimerase
MTRTALVVGGTGPTGPTVVEGLLERGYDVTILHGGHHENPDLPVSVPHVHADPHFAQTLLPALEGRTFDLVAAQYGRLRVLVDAFRGRAGQLIAIGASTGMAAGPEDPRWNRLGRPALLTEDRILRADDEQHSSRLAVRMAQAQDHLFAAHADGAFSATYLGYPVLYGPHQPGPQDWSVVRRALDGRRRMVIADGGLKLETRGYTRNVARAVLLAVDRADVAAGKSYIVCDPHTYTMRQRIEFVAAVAGHEFELVDLPWEQARPCHPLWRYERGHRLGDSGLIRRELGYTDELPVDGALAASVEWLLAHPFARGGAEEDQLGDPFDYAGEDRVIAAAERGLGAVAAEPYALPGYAHQYRHPKSPGEAWQRVAGAVSPTAAPSAAQVPAITGSDREVH